MKLSRFTNKKKSVRIIGSNRPGQIPQVRIHTGKKQFAYHPPPHPPFDQHVKNHRVNSKSGVVKLREDGHLGVMETLRGCVLSRVGTSPLETGTQATLLESSPMPDFPTWLAEGFNWNGGGVLSPKRSRVGVHPVVVPCPLVPGNWCQPPQLTHLQNWLQSPHPQGALL